MPYVVVFDFETYNETNTTYGCVVSKDFFLFTQEHLQPQKCTLSFFFLE